MCAIVDRTIAHKHTQVHSSFVDDILWARRNYGIEYFTFYPTLLLCVYMSIASIAIFITTS